MSTRWSLGRTRSSVQGGARLRIAMGAVVSLGIAVGCGVQSYSSKVRSQSTVVEPLPTTESPPPPTATETVAEATPAPPPEPELTDAQRAALVTTRKPLPTVALGFTLGGAPEDFMATCKKLGGWPTDKGDGLVSCRGPNPPDFKAETVEGRFCDGKLCVVTGVPVDKTPQRATRIQTTVEQEYGSWLATPPDPECGAMKEESYVHHWLWLDPAAPPDARIVGSIEVRFACQKAGDMPAPAVVFRDAAGHRAHGKLAAEDLK